MAHHITPHLMAHHYDVTPHGAAYDARDGAKAWCRSSSRCLTCCYSSGWQMDGGMVWGASEEVGWIRGKIVKVVGTVSLSLSLSLFLSLTHTHIHTHSPTLFLSRFLSRALSLFLSRSLARARSLVSWMLSVFPGLWQRVSMCEGRGGRFDEKKTGVSVGVAC